jgi:hypothetical protein
MQEKTNGAAGLAMLEAAEPLSWQDVAVRGYERSWSVRHADLRMDLSARIMALTGQRISSEDIYADGRLAVASVDGAKFRLYYGGDLVLVRTCAYCSTGNFESSQIDDLSDLGYALSAWRPLHEDCEEYSSEEFPDF